MQSASQTVVSEAEYLAAERAADLKHELWARVVYAMVGGSPRHNGLAAELIYLLGSKLKGTGCRPFGSDQRVHVPTSGNYAYPDVTVVCGDLEYHGQDRDSIVNPRVLIEVLSASTEAHDRGAKFNDYRSITGLAEYVLVSQDQARVEVRRRDDGPDGTWTLAFYDAEDTVVLRSLDVELTVADIYSGAFELRGDDPRTAQS